MLISKLGEFGLIERIKKGIKTDGSVIQGIGDDCAAVRFNKKEYLLWTTDVLVEGVDFTARDDIGLVGRKAVSVSISDIASCGGIPRYALVTLGLPKKTRISAIDKLYGGIRRTAAQYGINIIGGDITRSAKLFVEVSIAGTVEKNKLFLRKNAKEGDIIFVSGQLGGSIRGKHLDFTPRLKEARYLSKHYKINAMIDISDGLLQDLSHILTDSKVGAVVYEALIPIEKKARSIDEALHMGEDFELLFTMPLAEARRLVKESKIFSPIGSIVRRSEGFSFIDKRNKAHKAAPKGFTHF